MCRLVVKPWASTGVRASLADHEIEIVRRGGARLRHPPWRVDGRATAPAKISSRCFLRCPFGRVCGAGWLARPSGARAPCTGSAFWGWARGRLAFHERLLDLL